MTTNGLILTIPIKPNADVLNLKSIDSLNIEYWKEEVKKHGTYIPKPFMSKILILIF